MKAAMRYTSHFSDAVAVECGDPRALLGGKGASLKEMTQTGLAVPPGFTITTDTCSRYFELDRQWPEGLEDEVRVQMARLEEETGRRFGAGAKPLLVSVRSGAAVSMPGMMDTILNCGLHPGLAADVGDTPEFWERYLQFVHMFTKVVAGIEREAFDPAMVGHEDLPADRGLLERCLDLYRDNTGRGFPTDPWVALCECIGAVFDSWNNDRAVAYRKRNDIRGLNGTAVNVQMMFPSEVSGIVFTRDPNDTASSKMVIEASYGLGESVVSGDVTPDRFLVDRNDFSVTAHIGHKHCLVPPLGMDRQLDPDAPSLTDEQLRALGELSLRVEEHFGYPADIEFGLADGKFGLLQSRRIRGLDIVEDVEIGREEEIMRLRSMSEERHRCWVIHNLAETLARPTPLTWDIVADFMRGDGGFGRLYQSLGYRPSSRVRGEGFLELIGGVIYADPERLAELFWDAMPLTYDVDQLVADKSLLDRAPAAFDPARADGRFLAHLPTTLWAVFRSSRRMKRARAGAHDDFQKRVLPPYLEYVKRERERELGDLSDEQLLAALDERRSRVLDEFGPESLKPGFFGGLAFEGLTHRLGLLMGQERAGELARMLTRALAGDTTFEQDAMLGAVSRGETGLDEFLERFGHRCVGEMELANPRWREDPTYLEGIIKRERASGNSPGQEIHERNLAERREAEKDLSNVLRHHGGESLREPIQADLADAQALLPYRESGKHYLMMGYELIRNVLEGLAERWDLGGRLYFMHLKELAVFNAERERLLDEIEKRRIRHQSLQRLEMPDVIDSRNLEGLGLMTEVEASDELKGTAVASGVGTGPARIVFDPGKAGDLGAGYVLVCPSTDPGWTPLFMHANGLVVERGGVLSHGAIVARDFGIPAVVCPQATRLIEEGATVRIDGNTGRIITLETGK